MWLILSLGIGGFVIYAQHEDEHHPYECIKEAKVEIILALKGRDAEILLNTGETKIVNQAHLRPGDTICLKKERRK